MTTTAPERPATVTPVDAPEPDEGKRKVYRRTEEARAYLVVFGARLRALRDDAGMTQAGLAAAAGMHRVSLARAETGQMEVGVTNVVRLAAALGVAPGALFDVAPPTADGPAAG